MTLVDAEGRLFGRWNFVDAIVVVLLLAIGPVGYAAYVLFRTPDPTLSAIEPAEVVQGSNQRVTVRGTNLRPYLRVSFDAHQGRSFLFQDTTRAEIDLNEMPPGTYDVVLYDLGQERHRLPKALTVRERVSMTPAQDAIVVGRFIGLTKELAAAVTKAMPLPFPGEVLDVAPARVSSPEVFFGGSTIGLPTQGSLEVPAIMKLSCFLKATGGMPECGRADFTLRPRYILQIASTTGVGMSFQIDEVRGMSPPAELMLRVKLTGPPEAVALAKAGDSQAASSANPFSLTATIASIEPYRSGQESRTAAIRMRAQQLPGGWWEGSTFVRVGGQFMFVAEGYTLTAVVQAIDDPQR
jgi:hypothetical protein